MHLLSFFSKRTVQCQPGCIDDREPCFLPRTVPPRLHDTDPTTTPPPPPGTAPPTRRIPFSVAAVTEAIANGP